MTDTPGSTPPFPGFPGFPPAEMLDRMWGMMRLTPFGAAFPGTHPGAAQGFVPSLSMMSDMMAPLTNVEELDKRITDMRAVEQWLKLNLNMLQSAIQALEVQRATLATLRAFGAFAQSSMSQPAPDVSPHAQPSTAQQADDTARSRPEEATGESAQDPGDSAPPPGFDASGWWNLLQSQFNQIAQFAMSQPGMAAAGNAAGTDPSDGGERHAPEPGEAAGNAREAHANHGRTSDHSTGASPRQPAAKRPAAKRAPAAKRSGASAPRKTPDQAE
ncbi:PhaM family polyhydroxyalkanoate granule multifunctional regulatory protein [Paraburkholderia rhizosphaerae]|uniref:Uncharacterized protein n=1 Tax=Paraburkholderia rhizosphaerae TaxID=480658 RepID=A0A4V3HFK4_9BURK|nr:PhaM family polyhydroxyalkanoate granule multifunctional regulatory protein [Paraburkholderia rhizosphaerae]TDY53545.1 hypothetical protein BX592_103358 [Paraburkholderia rhizosphaerae]